MRKQWMAAAVALMTLAGAAPAQTTPAPSTPPDAALQRAQVLADLEVWHRAGMGFLPPAVSYGYVKDTPEYRTYQQLRQGPAFQEAVARHLNGVRTVAQRSEATAQP